MPKYVNRITVSIDGSDESNFSSAKHGEVELANQVMLMNKTGTSKKTGRFSCSLDYVVPEAGEVNWEDVGDIDTIKFEYENGSFTTYRNCAVQKVGEGTIDGEGQVTKTIDFIAEDKKFN